jgi:hypothetical protein
MLMKNKKRRMYGSASVSTRAMSAARFWSMLMGRAF